MMKFLWSRMIWNLHLERSPPARGGLKGHNGLKSIHALGSGDFWRLRIGISRPIHGRCPHSSFPVHPEEESPSPIVREAAKLDCGPHTANPPLRRILVLQRF